MKTLSLRYAAVALLLAVCAVAVSEENFLGDAANQSILELQERADADFAKGNFESAMQVYKEDLAPLGDKYSQYMVGYMYLAGKGVQEDAILASAWYRLAAQRETEQYVRIRDSLLELCNEEQISRSDLLYTNLRREIGDMVLVHQLIRDDIRFLHQRTNSDLSLQEFRNRKTSGRRLAALDAAAERIDTRVELLNRQMELETTLDESERNDLMAFIDAANREVVSYNASR